MVIWHLKKGSEKKFRSGHPWVFSNELAQSPKGITPGELIELRDFSGNYLATGYGHPNSLIAFRTLSFSAKTAIDAAFFRDRFLRASRVRQLGGVVNHSHRLCFAEGDHLPGLIIDRYVLANGDNRSDLAQAFVLQASTAGMDRLLPQIIEGLQEFTKIEAGEFGGVDWKNSALVIANDSKSRAMEGLAVEPKRVHSAFDGFQPENARILVQPAIDGLPAVTYDVDFAGGQKTGFFLDQRLNVQLTSRIANEMAQKIAKQATDSRRPVRILDLFCYVGQWGAQLANLFTAHGIQAEVVLVDASQKALELAAANVERAGGKAKIEKRDILGELPQFENGAFDIVICDPPAFVKKKKDLPTGSPAYFKLNREAIRKTRSGGIFVSCSCSGLFTEEDFRAMLARVSSSVGDRVRWLSRGSHSVDHPQRPEFPQGTYLKSWIGVIE